MHLDHGGNVCKFPKATFLVQKDEMKNAAWPEPGTAGPYIPGDVACLRNDLGQALPNKFKMEQLEGDLDLFGDGSVVIKRWPGHTPGSQMAIVRLPKTGTVVLTSDNVYFAENVTKNLLPDISLAYDPDGDPERLRVHPRPAGARGRELHDRPRPGRPGREGPHDEDPADVRVGHAAQTREVARRRRAAGHPGGAVTLRPA